MKIATWNVNSLNVRLGQVCDWLAEQNPDVLVLQELKLEQNKFPEAAFRLAGWQCAWSGQKTYNGVALISRFVPDEVQTVLPEMPDDSQRRVIAATIGDVRVINVYCVNGESLNSEKFIYKQQWFAALTQFVREQLVRYPNLVLLGDFNIAPSDKDVYDSTRWHNKILCSAQERAWFQALLDLGLSDALRCMLPEERVFTWWDYRGAMFQKGLGLRIDHILVSAAMREKLKSVQVDMQARAHERPSDHAPVIAQFAT